MAVSAAALEEEAGLGFEEPPGMLAPPASLLLVRWEERRPLLLPDWSRVLATAVLVMLIVVLLASEVTLGERVYRKGWPLSETKPSWNESYDFFPLPV